MYESARGVFFFFFFTNTLSITWTIIILINAFVFSNKSVGFCYCLENCDIQSWLLCKMSVLFFRLEIITFQRFYNRKASRLFGGTNQIVVIKIKKKSILILTWNVLSKRKYNLIVIV